MKIEILSDSLLADSAFDVQVTGLKPLSSYEVMMILEGYYNINAPMRLNQKTNWQAKGVYRSDEFGNLSLNKSYSYSGDYQGSCPMALFFNSKPLSQKKEVLPKSLEGIALQDSFDICVQFFEGARKLGEKRFKRYFQLPQVSYRNLSFSDSVARLFYPKGAKKLPAIIVVSGSEGRIEKAQNIAQLLASRGFVTLALAYFGLEGTPTDLDRIDLACVQESISYLQALPEVDSQRLGLYGRSKGAELALLAATYFPQFKAIVANAPSHAVMEGIRGFRNSKHSSWVYQDEELAFTKFSLMNFLKSRWQKRHVIDYEKASLIALDKAQASFLLIGSEKDEVWPAADSIYQLERRWRQAHLDRENPRLKSLLIKNSGHMLTVAYQPNQRYGKESWQENLRDSQQTWQASLDFFRDQL